MKTRWLWACLFTSLLVAIAFGGCSATDTSVFDDDESSTSSSGTTATTGKGGDGAGGECVFCNGGNGQGGFSPGGKLTITPADATLDVVDGTIPTQQFKAMKGDTDVSAQVAWVFERPDVGGVQGAGLFTPTGKVGGPGKLLALYNDEEAQATVTVNVKKTVNTANLPPADQAAFDAPNGGPDPSLKLLYPFDKTVLPLKVLAPEVQWTGSQNGDVFRIRLQSKHMNFMQYAAVGVPSTFTLDQAQWEDIEFSGTGPKSDPLKLEITRKSGPTIYQPVFIELRIAQGIVYGSVYYWQLPHQCPNSPNNGRILRIKPSSPTTDDFFPQGSCWGCHTVSRDGQALMATWDTGTPFPMQTLDLGQTPVQFGFITQQTGIKGVFAAFNNDGTKILYSDNSSSGPTAPSASLHIISNTGQMVLQKALGPGCGEPAWSPDGTKIAGICNMTNGGWTFDASTGDLVVADLNAQQTQVTQAFTVVPKGALPGRPAYPSFSPDSKYLAYGRPTSGSRSTGNGTLWLVQADGNGPRELLKASGDNKSFNPVFAPKAAGGYTWVVFISRRDYGHQLVNANRQQLWVTAVEDPAVDADPSSPPFFLRGQELCGKSENAYYALDPCKKKGDDCTHGIECCPPLQCIYDEQQKKHVCGEPDPNECVQTGNKCEKDADCCDYPEVTCINGFCEKKPPQ